MANSHGKQHIFPSLFLQSSNSSWVATVVFKLPLSPIWAIYGRECLLFVTMIPVSWLVFSETRSRNYFHVANMPALKHFWDWPLSHCALTNGVGRTRCNYHINGLKCGLWISFGSECSIKAPYEYMKIIIPTPYFPFMMVTLLYMSSGGHEQLKPHFRLIFFDLW